MLKKTSAFIAALPLFLVVASSPLHAQRAPSGLGVGPVYLQPSSQLGAGTIVGTDLMATLGVSPRVSLVASGGFYRGAQTEYEGQHFGRPYDLFSSSLGVRANLVGDRANFGLLSGLGVLNYKLGSEASSLASKETKRIPAAVLGASLQIPLASVLGVEFSARDWITLTRSDELSTKIGRRSVGHSPEVRLSLTLLLRPRTTKTASLYDLPVSYSEDFRPIDASSVMPTPIQATGGRSHLHVDEGAAIDLLAVSKTDFAGQTTPGSLSLVTPGTPSDQWEEQQLGTILFALGSDVVVTSYRTLLSDVATYMEQNPQARLVLRGYTDSRGGQQLNFSLAERRATKTKELLTRLYNVHPTRIEVESYGIDYRASSDKAARRVELIVQSPVP